jgi:hypothetical protein
VTLKKKGGYTVIEGNQSPDCNACGWREELRLIKSEQLETRKDIRGLREDLARGLQVIRHEDGQLELKVGPAAVQGRLEGGRPRRLCLGCGVVHGMGGAVVGAAISLGNASTASAEVDLEKAPVVQMPRR